jgi:hypothetical protein
MSEANTGTAHATPTADANANQPKPEATGAEALYPPKVPEVKAAQDAPPAPPAPEAVKKPEAEGEKKPEEVKAEESKDKKDEQPKVPEKYELKLPDGSPLDQKHIDKVAAFAKEKGLSNDAAQVILERESAAVQSFAETQRAALDARHNEWRQQAESDPVIGGEKLAETAELAKRALQRFGSEKLREELEVTRMGDHPEVLRMFAEIGRSMSNDKLILAGAQKGSADKTDHADVLYPKQI